MTDLGVVVIGRNEGERLVRCLGSLTGQGPRIVYVDSGSTDGSLLRARDLGADAVELDRSRPFSAARARNAGFARLRVLDPGLRYVMFVDGDCEVVAGWLDHARAELEARPKAAVVCGRRREVRPDHSVYNRLADLEWDTPVGEATSCGGDALMRAEAFAAVGGFDDSALAGEEPELCQRLRASGWSIHRLDAEMTRHDLAMTRFRQWWRRMYRGGYNGLDIQTRFRGDDQPFARELSKARRWVVLIPAVVVAVALALGFLGSWLAALVVVAAAVLVYLLRVARLAVKIHPRVGDARTSLAYGVLTVVGQFANTAGQAGYGLDRIRGRHDRLIEYKRVADVVPSTSP